MKVYIVSSEKHVGKIKEDIYIQNGYIKKNINSEIVTLDKVIEIAKPSDIVILKSIWGYHLDHKKFLKQISILEKKGIKLINAYHFIYWNIDKLRYLNELNGQKIILTKPLNIKYATGIRNIRSEIIKLGNFFNSDLLVIKPSISESGYMTFIYDKNKKNNPILNSLMSNKNLDFMIQSYQPSIIDGEISIIIINGKILYGVIRFPGVLSDKKNTVYLESINIPSSIKKSFYTLKKFFLRRFGILPNICRVDFIKCNSGHRILEIELIDPDLFFRYIPLNIRERAISILTKLIKY